MHVFRRKWSAPLLIFMAFATVTFLGSCGSTPEAADEETGEATAGAETTETGGESTDGEVSADPAGDSIEIGDEPVARVNGVPIFQSELDRFVEDNRRRLAQEGRQLNDEDQVMLREQVLGGLINREVLLQEAAELGLEATEPAIESQMANIRGQFDSDEAFREALEQQNLSETALRDNIRVQLAIDRLVQQEVSANIEITEEDKRTFYENNQQLFGQGATVEASHILIQTQGLSEDEQTDARTRAEAIREDVVGGADFHEVAQEQSEGPSAANGGRLGSFQRGQMVPAFEEAAFAMEPGEISEVVESQFGYHIILVTDKSEGSTQSYDAAEQQIEQYLTQQENNEALQSYVNRLRADAEVEILYDEVEEPLSDGEGDE